MTLNHEEVFEKVRDVLVDSLGVDDEEVERSSKLFSDLGAESIDILDIAFQLEKAFDIKIPQEGLAPPEELTTNADYVQDDTLTAAGLARLKAAMPHADFSEFEKDPKITRMPDLITVQTIVNFIEGKLAAA